ncbi:MAG TPA: hypothetical protein VMV31_14340 [Terriglobales bacterium]|nr:hypothetical protein [Terriglobales bacterium]
MTVASGVQADQVEGAMENATTPELDPRRVAKRCALCGIYFLGHLDGNYLCALCCSLRGVRADGSAEEPEEPGQDTDVNLTAA